MHAFGGKTAFITGGGTGIGLACARAVVEGGGRVMICGRREDALRTAAAQLGARASWTVCDVADESAVEAAVTAAEERNGPLHLAVNAAGVGSAGSILKMSAAEFSATIDTNLLGV